MLIKNPLKMYDWDIKSFLVVILTIQISVLGLIGLDIIGLKIFFIRELVTFVYLIFVPGILLLRLLGLKNLNNIESLLFTVGLSVTTLMILGFIINLICPFLGISNPISLWPVIVIITLFVLSTSFLCYYYRKEFDETSYINFDITPQVLFLCLIPILSILGSTIFYFYNQNVVFLIMIMMVSIIVLLMGFERVITTKYYPLTIIVISISLLFHTWLLSPFVFGRDIITELSISNLVLTNSFWNINLSFNTNVLPLNTNTMLINSIFSPIIAIIMDININNVYNIIFPLIISLTPLGLYELFRKQTNSQIAFLSTFLFIIMGFYNVILISSKQSMATFFIVVLLLCIIKKNNIKIALLSVLFLISIVISHYGTTYLFIFILFGAIVVSSIFQKLKSNTFINKHTTIKFYKKFNRISITIFFLFLTFAVAWYIFVSQSHVFDAILTIVQHIYTSIFEDFLNPESTQGLGMILTGPVTFSGYFDKAILLMIQLFIILGFLKIFFKDKMKFKEEFIFLAIPALFLDIFAVIVPGFSSALDTSRLYSITLVFLAPFATIGGIWFFNTIKIFAKSWSFKNNIKVISIIFVALFVLEVGAVKVIFNEPGISIPLSKEQMMKSDTFHKSVFYSDYDLFPQNYYATSWLANKMHNSTIYSDQPSSKAIFTYNIGLASNWKEYFPSDYSKRVLMTKYGEGNYIYLSYSNIQGKIWLNAIKAENNPRNIEDVLNLFNNLNEVYSNGGSDIYYT